MQMEKRGSGLVDVVATVLVLLVAMTLALPVVAGLSSRQRSVVCQDNLKKTGVALNRYFDDSGEYPVWDQGGHPDLDTFIDFGLKDGGYAQDEQIFLCPGDNPHPSNVNRDRSLAWGFNPFEYSYGIGAPAAYPSNPLYHAEKEHQVLTADAHFTWMQNLSAYYLLGYSWNNPNWYANMVAFRHKGWSANFCFFDGHVGSFQATFDGSTQTGPDTNEVFFEQPGESFNNFY